MKQRKLPNIGTDTNTASKTEADNPERFAKSSAGDRFAGNPELLKGKKKTRKDVIAKPPEFKPGKFTQKPPILGLSGAPVTADTVEAIKRERIGILTAVAEARSGRGKRAHSKRNTPEPVESPSDYKDLPKEVDNRGVVVDSMEAYKLATRGVSVGELAESLGFVGENLILTSMELALNAGDPKRHQLKTMEAQFGSSRLRGIRLPFTRANSTLVPIPNFLLDGLSQLAGSYADEDDLDGDDAFSVTLGDLLVEALAGYLAGKTYYEIGADDSDSTSRLRDLIAYEALARGMSVADFIVELYDVMGRGHIKGADVKGVK